MITSFMPSKAQIKARKLFALRSKRGDFRKGKKSSTKKGKAMIAEIKRNPIRGKLIYGKTPAYHRTKLRELGYTDSDIKKFLRSHGKD